MYSDKTLTCADCGQEFVFTASEQDFYAQRGFTEPRRCASCRASRKAARNSGTGAAPGPAAATAATAPAAGIPPAVATAATAAAAPVVAAAEAAATARTVVGIAIVGRGRCSPRPARTAARKPRSRSARPAASPSIARIASGRCEAAPTSSHPLGAGLPRARRATLEIPTRVVSRPGSNDSRGSVSGLPAVAPGRRWRRCRLRSSLTHPQVRSLRSSPAPCPRRPAATNAVGELSPRLAPAIANFGAEVVQ